MQIGNKLWGHVRGNVVKSFFVASHIVLSCQNVIRMNYYDYKAIETLELIQYEITSKGKLKSNDT